MARFKLFLPLAIFFLMALVLYMSLGKDPSHLPSALIDKPVPEFSLPSLAAPEKAISHSDIEGPCLINVWATWCPSCRIEHPYLLKLAAQGVKIYGLNYKDEAAAAQTMLKRTGNPYIANIFDAEGVLGLDLGVYGAPETFVVDAEGVIRYKHVGVVNEDVWKKHIAPLM